MTGTGAGGRARLPRSTPPVGLRRRAGSPRRTATRAPPGTAITLARRPRHLAAARGVRRPGHRRPLHQPPRPRGAPVLRRRSRTCASRRTSSIRRRRRAAAVRRAAPSAPGTPGCRPGRAAPAATTSRSASSSRAPTTCPIPRRSTSTPRAPAAAAAPPLPAGRPRRAQRRRAGAQDRPGAGLRLAAPARPARRRLIPGALDRPRRRSRILTLPGEKTSVLD